MIVKITFLYTLKKADLQGPFLPGTSPHCAPGARCRTSPRKVFSVAICSGIISCNLPSIISAVNTGLHCHNNKRQFIPAPARLCTVSSYAKTRRDSNHHSGKLTIDIARLVGWSVSRSLLPTGWALRAGMGAPACARDLGGCAGRANPTALLLWLSAHSLLSSHHRDTLITVRLLFITVGHLC